MEILKLLISDQNLILVQDGLFYICIEKILER